MSSPGSSNIKSFSFMVPAVRTTAREGRIEAEILYSKVWFNTPELAYRASVQVKATFKIPQSLIRGGSFVEQNDKNKDCGGKPGPTQGRNAPIKLTLS